MNKQQVEAKFRAQAAPMIAAALGETKTMRLDSKTTQSGVIVDAEFHHAVQIGNKWEGVFRVTLECGAAKVRKDFFCRKLPA